MSKPLPQGEIKVRNLEAEAAVLRNEIDEKTTILSGLLHKIDSCNEIFEQLEKQKQDLEDLKASTLSDLELKKSEAHREVANLHISLTLFKEELEMIRSLIKESTKELAKLNSQCITAEEDIVKKSAFVNELCQSQLQLVGEIGRLGSIKDSLKFFAPKLEETQSAIVTALAEKEAVIAQSTSELAQIKVERDKIVNEMEQAQYNLKSYTDQLYTNMNDYAVIRERLNLRWKEVYPELELPLEH